MSESEVARLVQQIDSASLASAPPGTRLLETREAQ